jgi:hypothetical protein
MSENGSQAQSDNDIGAGTSNDLGDTSFTYKKYKQSSANQLSDILDYLRKKYSLRVDADDLDEDKLSYELQRLERERFLRIVNSSENI